jgi:tol-pal system protein YbgF
MKKFLMLFVLVVCCTLLTLPALAGTRTIYPYPSMPPTSQMPYYGLYQQPYQQPYVQPYAQPCTPYAYSSCGGYPSYPPVTTSCWQGGATSAQQLYRCGLSLVYAKRYYDAIQVFHQFLNYYPQSSLADNALYWTGEAYYAQKQYYQAMGYFQQILTQYPHGNKVPDAMLKIALSHISLKRYNEGCQMIGELLHRYPNSEPAWKAYRWWDRCGGGYWGFDRPSYDSYSYGPQPQPIPMYSDSALPKNW